MEFKRENIDKVIQYVNLELHKNEKSSVNKICDKIGIKQSTFKNWAHKAGYSFDMTIRKYTKVIQMYNNSISTENENKIEEKTKVIQEYKDLNVNKLKELVDLLDSLKEIVKEHDEKSKEIIKPDLNPYGVTQVKQKLFKVDIKILKEWEQFVQAHNQFKVQDLISLALEEFINKYK